MIRNIKKFFKNNKKKKIKCTGCGRHEKEVPEETNWYFCNNCINNNNYARFKAGLEVVKPLEKIKEGDLVVGTDGKPYLILKQSYKNNEDTWYFCKQLFGKENELELGDFMFYKKTGKREINKINKTLNSGGSSINFIIEHEEKKTCLCCKYSDKNNVKCAKRNISLLDKECEAEKCDFYKEK